MSQLFAESLEARWFREYSIKAHKRHLREISLRSKSQIRAEDEVKLVKLRKLSQEFEKKKEIERENFLLFVKLNSIKERKNCERQSFGPKSLNISVRRRQAEKIICENYNYVKRFMDIPAFVSAEKQRREFLMQQVYKKTISKANLHKRLLIAQDSLGELR